MTCNVGDRLQFHDYTGRPNFRGLLRRRPDRPRVLRCRSCKRPRVTAPAQKPRRSSPKSARSDIARLGKVARGASPANAADRTSVGL